MTLVAICVIGSGITGVSAENLSVSVLEIDDSVTTDVNSVLPTVEKGSAIRNASDVADNSLLMKILARKNRADFLPFGLAGQTQNIHSGTGSSGNSVIALGSTETQPYTYVLQWGASGSGNGQFNSPHGIVTDTSGNVYVADTSNNRIQKFSSDGIYLTQWGTKGNGNGQFYLPFDITVDSSGNVYVLDASNHRVQKFSSDGTFISKWGTQGTGNGQFSYPVGIAADPSGNVYVADTSNNRVQKFSSDGTFISKWGTQGTGNGQFDLPFDVASDIAGDVYIADTFNYRVQRFNSNGVYITQWGTQGRGQDQFYNIERITSDTSGNIYVTDISNNRVQKFRSDGTYITQLGGTQGTGNAQLFLPNGVAVDAAGNLFIIEPYSSLNRIKKYKPEVVEPEVFTFSMTNTFSKYAGKDNCDNMADALKGIGWGDPVFYNTMESVTKSDFGVNPSPNQKTLNDAVLHYHVGHGGIPYGDEENLSGLGLLDQPGSFLSPSDVEGKWGNKNKWVILHSCYALVDDRWGRALSTSHGVLGFKTMVNVNPEFTNRFFHYAIDEKESVYDAFKDTTYDLYKNDPVPSGTIDGKPDYSSPQEIPVAAVVFGNNNQAFGDHLPDIGTGVTPDSLEGPLYRDQWRCNEDPR